RFGPRDDWFVAGAADALCGSPYQLTTRSNRVGARLAGEPIVRANAAELPSEGLVLGAVQITPDGSPIVFLADHPTTGGYPVIGVVNRAAVAALAQVRPGAPVRFHPV
ncbi:MAG TPA: allophanate hydrolase subunit 2 family protein, partial [Micromonosporaceae bacterium]